MCPKVIRFGKLIDIFSCAKLHVLWPLTHCAVASKYYINSASSLTSLEKKTQCRLNNETKYTTHCVA